jgi:LysM repeat protein
MKTNPCFVSLFAVLLASTPLLSAGEVERLRALVAEQEMQIQQLELKVAQLTNTPSQNSTPESKDPAPVSTNSTQVSVPTPPSKDGLIPTAETCPEPADTENPKTYTIQAGDNMVSIARKHGTTSAILNELNGLKKDAIIRSGQTLKLPQPTAIAATQAEPAPTTVNEPEPVASEPISTTESVVSTEPASSEPILTPDASSSSAVKHTVADKETFYSIAKKHNVTINALIKENPSVNPNTIRIGQIVQIPGKPKTTDLTSASAPKPEQSLSPSNQRNIPISNQTNSTANESRAADKPIKITKEISYIDFAKKYNTTPARLDQLNGLHLDPTTILAKGSELYIPEQP